MRDRSAFGYAEPVGDATQFAQCKTCRVWLKNADRCYWLQPNDEAKAGDSCIYYVQGEPITDESVEPIGALTKSEAGLVRGDVRCENCTSFDKADTHCELYRKMNRTFPTLFKLDARVEPKACCSAFDSPDVKNLY